MRKVCIDFDATIHSYTKGWNDGKIEEEPIKGAIESLVRIWELGYQPIILTAREEHQHDQVRDYILHYLPKEYKDIGFEVTNIKPAAIAYIDDRGIEFRNWEEAMRKLIDKIDKEIRK